MVILTNFLYQILFTVGLVILFGFVISLCRRLFVRLLGSAGYKTLLATGIVGTPIHELSHALMCLIFGHRIEEIKLYDPTAEDGALGYVSHGYNPKNVYHQIGNFFIGIAPIVCGSGVLLLLMLILVPEAHSKMALHIEEAALLTQSVTDKSAYVGYLALLWSMVKDIFSLSYMGKWSWWIFIVIAIMISSHMELSRPDIKSGAKGFLYIAGILLAVDVVVGIISQKALLAITSAMSRASLYILGFLWLSAMFCVALVVVALLIKGIKRIAAGGKDKI